MGVADFFDALQGFLCLQAIDRGLHRCVSRPVTRGKRLLNLANGECAPVPERFHDLQFEFGELGKGHIDLLCLYVRLLREYFVSKVVSDLFEVACGFGSPSDIHRGFNSRSIRATTSSCSSNSPRPACSMPRRTAARNCASSLTRRKAASFTSCSASVPLSVAILERIASCSGVKWTSICL